MHVVPRALIARIEWCQRQRALAGTELECDRWQAEADGLRDALLSRNQVTQYCGSPADILERYSTGLCDGQLMLRVERVTMRQERDFAQSADCNLEYAVEEAVGSV